MSLRVAITGANSATGRQIIERAQRDEATRDWELVACVRSERAESQLPPLEGTNRAARISYDEPASLAAAFSGADCVIHLPGVLIERKGSTFDIANVQTTRQVIEAARSIGAGKAVLVSAVGADSSSRNRYYRTKGEAEELVRASGLPYTILRAPLVLGPGTEGARALARNAAQQAPRLLGGGRNLQQPLDVGDLARACLRATQLEVAADRLLELVGPESLPDRELVERAARALGGEVRIGSTPVGLVKWLARVRTLVTGPGFSADAVEVITDDTQLDPGPAAQALGIELTSLDEMIARSVLTET
jgi:NADH dehydrogenase